MMLVPGLSRLPAAAVAAAAVIAAMAVAVCGCGGGGQGTDAIDGSLSDVSAPDAAARDAGGDAWTDQDGRDPPDQGAPDASASADPAHRLRYSGWLSGDLHMHSTFSDGEDPVAVTVGLAEYFQNPVFLTAHPEYAGNPVDFIALTDHRTAAGDSDPTYASDRVILIPGEEFGGPGHVGMYGVTATIPHDPGGDGPTLGDYYGGMEIAAMQGAVRTINHPCRVGNPFGWNLHDVDAVEVWNMAWATGLPGITPDDVADWESVRGTYAGPAFRKAARYSGIGGNAQALKYYEALLSRGWHVAVVGGSDRHRVLPLGFPTTFVRAATRDARGILDGIRARHTFVARSPVSATVEMDVTAGIQYEMGDAIPVPADGAPLTIKVRATRAAGGRLRIIGGHHVDTDDALQSAELGVALLDVPIDSDDFWGELVVTARPGDWFYPVVWEPVSTPGLAPELAAEIPGIAADLMKVTDGDRSELIAVLQHWIDGDTFVDPATCDPAAWNPDNCQCLPPDDNGTATLFIPDWINRVMNGIVDPDGHQTPWSMGAVGSSVIVVEDAPVDIP